MIRESFVKKLNKQGNGVYQDTILGIVIDDDSFYHEDLLAEGLKDIISKIQNTPNAFLNIYLVGNNTFFLKIK
tara:strand:+ start:38502 stop:38720 length:219 start_codon:yes stop_codon:yes gene_type:complete